CRAAHSGPIFHMVSYAAYCGVAPLMAAAVFGAAGLAALSGRIICGLIADRTGAKRTLVACLALQAVAIALYVLAHDLDTLYAISVLLRSHTVGRCRCMRSWYASISRRRSWAASPVSSL